MSNSTPAIRLSVTKEVSRALSLAKKRYPTLSDPEILKLGLSKIITEHDEQTSFNREREAIRTGAAEAVGQNYLGDPVEDVYSAKVGRKVHFS
jgi:hypothetical protein